LLNPAGSTSQPDTAVQKVATRGALTASNVILNIPGLGNGFIGFGVDSAPPDTNGAVGATQYVQWVNESFAVFDKATGISTLGPMRGNTLWSGFADGKCSLNNDGDPIVQY